MTVNDITYSSRTVLANISRLHSLTNAQAKTFGEIVGGGELGNNIRIKAPINSSATGGSYDLYMVESQDGVEWTDDIDPTADTGDVAAKISDAIFVTSMDTTYDGTNRTDAEIHFQTSMLSSAKYIGFVLLNNSGQTTPASGADGDSVTYKIAST